jgi:hypothetical protein
MKFVISESQKNKIESSIYQFIDNLFPSKIDYQFYDEEGNVSDDFGSYDSIEFVDEEWEGLFRIYFESYFKDSRNFKNKYKFPYIEIEKEYLTKLDNYFGDKWHSVFQEWFDNKFPKLNLIKFGEFEKTKKKEK